MSGFPFVNTYFKFLLTLVWEVGGANNAFPRHKLEKQTCVYRFIFSFLSFNYLPFLFCAYAESIRAGVSIDYYPTVCFCCNGLEVKDIHSVFLCKLCFVV